MQHLVKLIDWIFEIPPSAFKEENINVISSPFTINYQGKTSNWQLQYFFNGENLSLHFYSFASEFYHCFILLEIAPGSVGVYLKLLSGDMSNDVQFNIYLRGREKDTMRKIIYTREEHHKESFESPVHSWFLTLDEVKNLKLGKKFNVKAEIYFTNIHHITKACNASEISNGKCLEFLIFEQPEVQLKTKDGMEFRGNREYLSKKSEVFKKMFSEVAPDTGEAQNGIIEIKEFSGKVVMELLRFIYFARVHNIDSFNLELFKAAKMFEIEALPELCVKSIMKCVNTDNMLQIVQFAAEHQFEPLFLKCCEIINL